MRANAQWRAEGADWRSRQVIAKVAPVRVSTESEELALVTDLPAALEQWLRPGDWLLGEWMDGRFRATGVLPAESLPARPVEEPANKSED